MLSKASIFRREPGTQSALALLSKLLGRPMNKLVSEAVRDYLQKTTPQERDLEDTLASLRAYRERDSRVNEASKSYRPIEDSEVVRSAREFVRRISERFDVEAAVLFGSRARGDHRGDSDVDIAIILRGSRGNFLKTSLTMSDVAFDVLLDTNVYIAPLPIWLEEWEKPATYSNPRLLENIKREGRPL